MNKIIFFLAIIIFFAIPIHAQFVSDSNTLALWHMDEGIGPFSNDATIFSRNLELRGTEWSEGNFNKGLKFSGSAFAFVSSNMINFDAHVPFAVDGFVKINTYGERLTFIYFRVPESFSRTFAIIIQPDGRVRCDFRANSQVGTPYLQQAFGVKDIVDGKWHRITCTRTVGSNPRLLLFVDNALEYNATGNIGALGFGDMQQVGFARDTLNQGGFELDEWRIVNTTLYPKQEDYNRISPVINILIPATNNTNTSNVTQNLIFNATSTIHTNGLNYKVFRNDLLIITGSTNNNTNIVVIPGSPNGTHTYKVQVTDPSGNSNSSTITWTTDQISPKPVNLTANNTNFSTPNPSFAFNVTDNTASSTINITLFINGAANGTSILINNNTNGTINGTAVANGVHTFVIQAIDPAGNAVNTTQGTFRVNTIEPPLPCNCTNLTQKVEELKQRIGELENRVNDAENRLGVAESQLIDSENKISDLESKLNDSENKVNDLESRLGDAESKITDFDNELRATNNKLDILENKLNNTTSSFESLKLRVDAVFGYLKNLLLPIKKEMVCGYMKDNKLTKHEALGLKCSISRNNCICSIA